MSLTKETGSGVSGANTYADQSDFESYCDNRGLSYSGYSDDDIEAALIRATDYLDSLSWKGAKEDEDNPLKWPRSGVEDGDGIAVDSDEIPTGIVYGCCRAAYEELIDNGCLLENVTRDDNVKREKIGPIETEYFELSSPSTTEYRALHAHIDEYLITNNTTLKRC